MTDSEGSETALAYPTDPFFALDRWFDDLANRVGESAGFFAPSPGASRPNVPRPARTDLLETPEGFQILAELPGVAKDQLDLRIKGTTVEIRATSGGEVRSEGPTYLHRERRHATFERYVELPEPIVPGKAKATLREGLLTVDLPKEHPAKAAAEVRVPIE
ncbi:MAG TPA: Hsp20/alpha crystallin family protein [Thermoplasmata archaeon]|nr:Hsp20/alpha crystallin family protein [Thermoplasmata archaeon]